MMKSIRPLNFWNALTGCLFATALFTAGLFTTASYTQAQQAERDVKPLAKIEAKDADEDADANEASDAEEAETPKIKTLTIGSVAPPLDIENWIHDGEGKFEHVTEFKPNKVYVVEFWATWCGPCIYAMPHIVETQQKYADAGVQIVSVSREDTETIEKFLDREVPKQIAAMLAKSEEAGGEDAAEKKDESGDSDSEDSGSDDDDEEKAMTFRQLTSSYCLTSDPDNSTSEDYMTAAGRNGIPCAFIVGKDGHIEWIGHPMSMDEALDQVVNDSWDRAAFAEQFIEEQRADLVYRDFVAAMRSGKTEEALKIINDFIETGKNSAKIAEMKMAKIQILASDPDRSDDLKTLLQEMVADDSLPPNIVNTIGWTVYRLAASDKITDQALLRVVLKKTESVADSAGTMKPYILDTVAHLQQALGDTENAIATQTEAVRLADESGKARLQRFLDELTAEPEPAEEDNEADDKADDKEE